MPRLCISLLSVLFVLSGCSESGTLVIQVRTDLAPRLEMSGAGVDLQGRGSPGEWDVFLMADGTRDWAAGVRVAEFSELDAGEHILRVGVEAPDGSLVVARPVRVRITSGVQVVTVLLTRDCASAMCPGADPLETACLAGRCVRPECVEERAEECGPPACASETDCPASPVACARAECTASGACVVLPMPDACGSSATCSTVSGCVPDAMPLDAGIDGGADPDAGAPTGCAPAGPTVSAFGPSFGARGASALATDGSSLAVAYPITVGMDEVLRFVVLGADGVGTRASAALDTSSVDSNHEVDLAFGVVGAPATPFYMVAWAGRRVLHTARITPSDYSFDAGPFTDASGFYARPSIAHDARDGTFAVLVERDTVVAFHDLGDGGSLGPPLDREAATANRPSLFWMDGLYGALWFTAAPPATVRFEAIDPVGGRVGGPVAFMAAPATTQAIAPAWLSGSRSFWAARGEADSSRLELGEHGNDGVRIAMSSETTETVASQVVATAHDDTAAFVWLDRNAGGWRVRLATRGTGGPPRVDIHPAFDSRFMSAAQLHVDDVAYFSGAHYVAVRSDTLLQIYKVCDPP